MTQDTFNLIERIAATPSKNDKETLLRSHADAVTLKNVLDFAYNPYKVYGFAEKTLGGITTQGTPGGREFDVRTWGLLDDLILRNVTGHDAIASVELELRELEPASSQLLRRILLKDLRAGFSESTTEKVFPGLLPSFPYMRCSLQDKSNFSKWDFGVGIVSQEKADGMFANVNVRGKDRFVYITSRQGSPVPLTHLGDLAEEIRTTFYVNTQTHGELLVFENDVVMPREKGNGVLNSIINGGALEPGQSVRFFAWDQIPLDAVKPKGKYDVPYTARLKELLEQLRNRQPDAPAQRHVTLIPTKVVYTREHAFEHYRELLRQGKEGTILKHPGATWKDGTSRDQVKLKLEVDVDLRINGILPGTPGTKNEGRPGSLSCVSSCGCLVVDVTVKNEKMRDEIEQNPSDFIGKILAVRANSVMPPSESSSVHSLFLPRMVEASYRTDKSEADSLESIKSQFANAVA